MKLGDRIRNLLNEDILNGIIRNSGILFGGNAVTQLLGLISISLTTSLIGVKEFGILIVIQTYTLIVDGLLNFQSWQALIKFGTEALEQKDIKLFKGYIKFGTMIDFITALIGTIVAMISIQLIGPILNLTQEYIYMATLYSLTIFFNLSGTPTAVLRIFGRYKLFAVQQIIAAIFKVIGIIIAYLFGANFKYVLLVWILTEIIGQCILLFFGHFVLFKNNIRNWWTVKIKNLKEILKFTWWTNLTSIFDLPVKQLDIMIVSLVISFEGVAIYKVFKQITQVINKVSDPIYQVIYPQLVQMVTNRHKEESVKLVKKTGLILATLILPVILIVSITSPFWLNWFFGEEYAEAWLVLAIFLILRVLSVSFIGVHPLFIAFGFVKKNIFILILSNLVYLILTWLLGNAIGLVGIVIAYGVQFSIVLLLKIYHIKKDMQKVQI